MNTMRAHQLQRRRCVQIVTFMLMSAVVFLGFAQSFFLGFYTSNDGYQSLMEAVMSMLRLTTGDVDYEALNRTNTVLAPLLYTLSLFVLGFVWTSLLLAIVINAYYDEVNDVRPAPPRACRPNAGPPRQRGHRGASEVSWPHHLGRPPSIPAACCICCASCISRVSCMSPPLTAVVPCPHRVAALAVVIVCRPPAPCRQPGRPQCDHHQPSFMHA